MAEALDLTRPQDAAFVNPRACKAIVEVHTIAESGNKLGVDVTFDCRKCPVFERFESVGTRERVSGVLQGRVTSIARKDCLNLLGQEITPDLLPQVNFS